MLEKIMLGIFKGVLWLIEEIIKGIYRLISGAVQRKGRDVYAPPANPATSGAARPPALPGVPPPPLPVVPQLPPQPEADPLFLEADTAVSAGQHEAALQMLTDIGDSNGSSTKIEFQLAHRYLALFDLWEPAYPEPDKEAIPEWDERRSLMIKREHTLREPLYQGCQHIDELLARESDYPNGRMLGRKLHGALARSCWDWGPKAEGYQHQKRVIELTDALIDYDLLDLAQRCALEGQVFGDFFDLAEALFKQGRITPDNHHYAAMVYEGAVHSERWPISATDRKRAPEFLKAALAHLEYCERHKQELGPHWHNVMARVLAARGQLDDARLHFQRFKDLAAKAGDGMIAVFGKDTIRVFNHYIEEHNAMLGRSGRR
jgi:hypothetical protein